MHPRSESRSRLRVVQKDLEETNLLSQEILRAVQNSEILVSPKPFWALVAYKVLEESTIYLLLVLRIFLISSFFLEILGRIAAICASFGNIKILITQTLPKTVKYLYFQLLVTFYFFHCFKKIVSISSKYCSKSKPNRVNFVCHLRH